MLRPCSTFARISCRKGSHQLGGPLADNSAGRVDADAIHLRELGGNIISVKLRMWGIHA